MNVSISHRADLFRSCVESRSHCIDCAPTIILETNIFHMFGLGMHLGRMVFNMFCCHLGSKMSSINVQLLVDAWATLPKVEKQDEMQNRTCYFQK